MRPQEELRRHTKAADLKDTPIDRAASILEFVDVVVVGRNLPSVSAGADIGALLGLKEYTTS
jgi:hypothetical protein